MASCQNGGGSELVFNLKGIFVNLGPSPIIYYYLLLLLSNNYNYCDEIFVYTYMHVRSAYDKYVCFYQAALGKFQTHLLIHEMSCPFD